MLLVSLHQLDLALRYCDREIALLDGRVRFDSSSAVSLLDIGSARLRRRYIQRGQASDP
ncbi:MAG: hypothetical protein ACREF9_13130 [Opitutaceae bacterium]